jgi:hypothetical protein
MKLHRYSKQDLEKLALETNFIRDNLEKAFRLCNILAKTLCYRNLLP